MCIRDRCREAQSFGRLRSTGRHRRLMRQSHRMGVVAVTIVAVAIAAPVLALHGSLPAVDGRVAASELTAPVTVERDALGVPTIAGSSRNDVAYATGYVHAQDRY